MGSQSPQPTADFLGVGVEETASTTPVALVVLTVVLLLLARGLSAIGLLRMPTRWQPWGGRRPYEWRRDTALRQRAARTAKAPSVAAKLRAILMEPPGAATPLRT